LFFPYCKNREYLCYIKYYYYKITIEIDNHFQLNYTQIILKLIIILNFCDSNHVYCFFKGEIYMKDYEKVNILRQFSNLEDLTDDEYNKIKPFLMHKKINKNEHLFHCGEKMESIYFLISGKIKTYKTNVNGKEFLVQLYSGKD